MRAQLLQEEGLSQRFLAIFFLVDIYTVYCSPVHFIALLNHLLKEEGLSQNVPAISFWSMAIHLVALPIHFIVPLY